MWKKLCLEFYQVDSHKDFKLKITFIQSPQLNKIIFKEGGRGLGGKEDFNLKKKNKKKTQKNQKTKKNRGHNT